MTVWSRVSAAMAMVFASLALPALAVDLPPAVNVKYAGGKLSLQSNGAAVREVLAAVSVETGVRFVIDPALEATPITIRIDGLPLERAVVTLVAALPQASGHALSYTAQAQGPPRLAAVSIFATGRATAPAVGEPAESLVRAGVRPEIAEKAGALVGDVRRIEDGAEAERFRVEDLSPAAREKFQRLVDDGVPQERAVRAVVLHERAEQALRETSKVPGGPALLLHAAPRDR